MSDELEQALTQQTETPAERDFEAGDDEIANAMAGAADAEQNDPEALLSEDERLLPVEASTDEPEPGEEPGPQEEPGPKPDPLQLATEAIQKLVELQTPKAEPPKPERSKREILAENYQAAIKAENLAAALKAEGYEDTAQNRAWLKSRIDSDARQLDTMFAQEELQAEIATLKRERDEARQASQLAPAFAASGIQSLPQKAQGLVTHYAREYMSRGASPQEAVALALEETGLTEIVAERAKRPAQPAAKPSPQRQADKRTVAAQAVAGRAAPTAPPAKPRGQRSQRDIEARELAYAKSLM
jgi:hypothetical protein